ncbi:MAG: OmpA family protein [Deltaproteobacteria bacterium]|nr:OmpA family protein [Deltaproteobacteria bacterium]
MTNGKRARLAAGSILVALLVAPGWAFAQNGFTLDRFQPAPAGDRFFGVQGGDPGGHLSPRAMLLADYAYKPLVLHQASDDTEVGAVVGNQLFLHVGAGISLWDRLWISASMPFALYADGDDPVAARSPSGAALGDVRAGVRVRLVGENRSLATLALAGYVFFPTGDKEQFAGAENVHGMPALVLSGETEDLAYAVNAGVDLGKRWDGPDEKLGSDMTFGAGVAYLLLDGMLQVGPEIYGSTAMTGTNSFTRETTNLEAIVGARMRVGPLVFGLGGGPGITQAMGTPTLRGLASVAYAPLPPKPAPPPPPPVAPPPPPPPDRDGDGILDKDDACPDEPGIGSSDPQKNGCPPPPPDRDGDGILDKDDACPDLAGVMSSDPTQNGCPPDTDGDGIRDDVDACPREKGKPDADPQKNGCPGKVRVTEEEIVILEQVRFKTGSSKILPASDELLTQVAAVLAEHPEILKVEVQGHTDNRGKRKYNKKLSEKRAASVVKWLVKRGQVDAGRLTSHGYGMEEPIAENDTAEGRQKNRRVQFKIVEKTSRKSEVSQ